MISLSMYDANDFIISTMLDGNPYKLHFSWNDHVPQWTEVRRQAKKAGLFLDGSPWEDTVMGLPFHYPYLVKRKGGKRL